MSQYITISVLLICVFGKCLSFNNSIDLNEQTIGEVVKSSWVIANSFGTILYDEGLQKLFENSLNFYRKNMCFKQSDCADSGLLCCESTFPSFCCSHFLKNSQFSRLNEIVESDPSTKYFILVIQKIFNRYTTYLNFYIDSYKKMSYERSNIFKFLHELQNLDMNFKIFLAVFRGYGKARNYNFRSLPSKDDYPITQLRNLVRKLKEVKNLKDITRTYFESGRKHVNKREFSKAIEGRIDPSIGKVDFSTIELPYKRIYKIANMEFTKNICYEKHQCKHLKLRCCQDNFPSTCCARFHIDNEVALLNFRLHKDQSTKYFIRTVRSIFIHFFKILKEYGRAYKKARLPSDQIAYFVQELELLYTVFHSYLSELQLASSQGNNRSVEWFQEQYPERFVNLVTLQIFQVKLAKQEMKNYIMQFQVYLRHTKSFPATTLKRILDDISYLKIVPDLTMQTAVYDKKRAKSNYINEEDLYYDALAPYFKRHSLEGEAISEYSLIRTQKVATSTAPSENDQISIATGNLYNIDGDYSTIQYKSIANDINLDVNEQSRRVVSEEKVYKKDDQLSIGSGNTASEKVKSVSIRSKNELPENDETLSVQSASQISQRNDISSNQKSMSSIAQSRSQLPSISKEKTAKDNENLEFYSAKEWLSESPGVYDAEIYKTAPGSQAIYEVKSKTMQTKSDTDSVSSIISKTSKACTDLLDCLQEAFSKVSAKSISVKDLHEEDKLTSVADLPKISNKPVASIKPKSPISVLTNKEEKYYSVIVPFNVNERELEESLHEILRDFIDRASTRLSIYSFNDEVKDPFLSDRSSRPSPANVDDDNLF